MASEFIDEWNKVQPLHIKESDLKTPTESFVRKCVSLLLKQMFVQLDFMENIDFDCKDAKVRAARIRLVHIVNHFYQTASPGEKQVNFFLMDLMKPNYRKTYMVLRNLLNYLLYQRMVKASTVDIVDRNIGERDALLSERNRLKKEIENCKIHHQSTRRKINESEILLPKMKVQINDMSETEVKLKKSLDALNERISQVDLKMLEVQPELNDLKRMVVTDKEAEAIINAKKDAESEIEEQDQIMVAARNKIKENVSALENLTEIISKSEIVLKSVLFDPAEVKALKKSVETLEKDLHSLKTSLDTNNTIKKSLTDQINSLKMILVDSEENKKMLTKKFSLKKTTQIYNSKLSILDRKLTEEQTLIFEKEDVMKKAGVILKMVEAASDYLMS